MTTERDMSLRVKSSPSAAFLPSSLATAIDLRGSVFENNPSASSGTMADLSIDSSSNNTSQKDLFGGGQEEKGDDKRSIVCANTSRSNDTWRATRAREEEELRKEETDTVPPVDGVLMASSIVGQDLQSQLQPQHSDLNSIISHQPTSSPSRLFATTNVGDGSDSNLDEALFWGTRGLFTTPFGSSLQGIHPNPFEPALGLMTGRSTHESAAHTLSSSQQQQSSQPPLHYHHSSLTLLAPQPHQQQQNRPPIQQHTATAAEIALGLPSSSFSQNDQEMGYGTRNYDSRNASVDQGAEYKQDSKSAESGSSDSSFRGKDSEEETSRTEDTLAVNSSGRMTPPHDLSDHGSSDPHRSAMVMGTPSTVSTAPSSDDASLGTDYKLDDSLLPNLLHPLGMHRRANSWGEDVLLPASAGIITPPRETIPHQNPWLTPTSAPPPHSQRLSWSGGFQPQGLQHPPHLPQQQQRIATFRQENPWGKPQHISVLQGQNSQHLSFSHQHVAFPHQQVSGLSPPQQQQLVPHGQTILQGPRKQSYAHQAANAPVAQHGIAHNLPTPMSTPPKIPRQLRPGARQTPVTNQVVGQHPTGTNSRSASEILKTLLRKKACLYEPDTSRSVALVTWLVGRILALEHGFFSRQQLQSGVHACVSDKIEVGTITRTKVNRCMQIILNSCFHYIIPRSDGTEEKGDHFRAMFEATVQDDSEMLQYLPEPWNDLDVDREAVLEATLHDSDDKTSVCSGKSPSATPKSSPKLGSVNAEKSPDRESHDGEKDDSKRAVLLCFNENVRSAEDVFRCHNEFIRDTANAAHLQLTAQEWRQFFGREESRAPYLWGSVGIPTLTGESATGPPRRPDLLGQMSKEEVSQFRSTWCTKRYEHDHDLCGFAHVEVNGGWLRRNPLVHPYKDDMCQFISTGGDKMIGPGHFFLNECPKGVHCDHAHSMEEIVYHPNRYKNKVCTSLYSQSRGCRSGDVCPNLHPPDVTKPMRKAEMMRSQGGRRSKHEPTTASAKPSVSLPTGSPVVYASPAPFSSFDQLLGMPGLQSIFRRQSSVIRAHVRSGGKVKLLYSPFGDDWGLVAALPSPESEGGRAHRRGKSS